MKNIFLIIILTVLFSCTEDNIDSGLSGYIEFAEVDCDLDESFWNLKPYNGKVYILHEDSLGSSSHNYLKKSDSTQAEEGEFSIGLDPGNYYIFIKEYQIFSDNNKVTVNLNQVSKPDFYFHTCK